MNPAFHPRVKICCIASVEEARMAVEAGASAVGLVAAMPSGPGVLDEGDIRAIARSVPPGVATFLLTSETSVPRIVAQHRRCRTTTLQLVDALESQSHRELREALPGIGIVQVIHVQDARALREAAAVAPDVDAILLDSGRPHAAVKELGGTGRTHDWTISRRIRDTVAVPVYLAGGLTPENVRAAIGAVGPFGVDLCNGVRRDGELDPRLLAAFFDAVRSALTG